MPPPSLFLSHGSPALILEDCPARSFLRGLGQQLERPTAILVASAHWETGEPTLGAAEAPETIHDFYGFPRALYELRYPAPGAPALAEEAAGLLTAAGFDPQLDPAYGLDHGAWSPLCLIWPEADIPVAQLSVQPYRDAEHHYRLGEALRPLRREGVLIVGSGLVTHNLQAFRQQRPPIDSATPTWVSAFADWIAAGVVAGDHETLLDWQAAPHARDNHPTPEHFLPFFVALGAGTPDRPGRALHRSSTYGILAMDFYAFD